MPSQPVSQSASQPVSQSASQPVSQVDKTILLQKIKAFNGEFYNFITKVNKIEDTGRSLSEVSENQKKKFREELLELAKSVQQINLITENPRTIFANNTQSHDYKTAASFVEKAKLVLRYCNTLGVELPAAPDTKLPAPGGREAL